MESTEKQVIIESIAEGRNHYNKRNYKGAESTWKDSLELATHVDFHGAIFVLQRHIGYLHLRVEPTLTSMFSAISCFEGAIKVVKNHGLHDFPIIKESLRQVVLLFQEAKAKLRYSLTNIGSIIPYDIKNNTKRMVPDDLKGLELYHDETCSTCNKMYISVEDVDGLYYCIDCFLEYYNLDWDSGYIDTSKSESEFTEKSDIIKGNSLEIYEETPKEFNEPDLAEETHKESNSVDVTNISYRTSPYTYSRKFLLSLRRENTEIPDELVNFPYKAIIRVNDEKKERNKGHVKEKKIPDSCLEQIITANSKEDNPFNQIVSNRYYRIGYLDQIQALKNEKPSLS